MTRISMDFENNSKQAKPEKKGEESYGLFDLLWQAVLDIPNVLRNLKFAVTMIVILAVFTLIGTILPQEKFASDPQQFERQYIQLFNLNPDDGKVTFGEIVYNGLVAPLELHRIFETGLYFTLMLVLTISSAICAYDRILLTRAIYRNKRAKVKPELIRKEKFVEERKIVSDVQEVAGKVRGILRSGNFELFEETDPDGTVYIFGRKNIFRYIATLVFHFALVGILIGGLIGNERFFGFEDRLALAEGETGRLGFDHQAALAAREKNEPEPPVRQGYVELAEYYNVYRESEFGEIDENGFPEGYFGMPSDYISHLKVLRPTEDGGTEAVTERDVEVNIPLRYGGINYYQLAVNDQVHLTVITPEGQEHHVTGFLGESVQLPVNLDGYIPIITIQSRDLVGGIWEDREGNRMELPFAVRLVDYSHTSMGNGGPISLGYVAQDKPLGLEGNIIRLDEITEYSIFQYVYDPGVELVTMSSILLVFGIFISMYFPFRKVRIIVRPGGKGVTMLAGSNMSDIPAKVIKSVEAQDEVKQAAPK